MNNFEKKFKKLRERVGITPKQLADKAGIDPAYISQLEDGRYKSISLKKCKQLADGLGLTLREFLEDLGLLEHADKSPSFSMITEALRTNGYNTQEIKQVTAYAKFLKSGFRVEK